MPKIMEVEFRVQDLELSAVLMRLWSSALRVLDVRAKWVKVECSGFKLQLGIQGQRSTNVKVRFVVGFMHVLQGFRQKTQIWLRDLLTVH